jgi:hypothetical protein
MKESQRILACVERAMTLLPALSDEETHRRAAPDKWSKKEILGHLIDSASNNHQRFVRALSSTEVVLPGYAQTEWVKGQDYEHESWTDIVGLWASLNRHLAHVIERIPEEKTGVRCRIGERDLALGELIPDYVAHLEHHLKQIHPGL